LITLLMHDHFKPHIPFRSAHVQTILGSSRLRALGAGPLVHASNPSIIDAGQGVRLLGFLSRQRHRLARGLVALIHGWEGSSNSSYILSAGQYLFERGYDIFRLNLRDHGESHHLNEGLFHGALIEETASAVREIALLAGGKPFFLMGFSLGGNFALRIALRQATDNIANLEHVVAVSPALDPLKSTLSIDNSTPIYRYYFLKKWKRSLRKKQALFPDRYDFRPIMQYRTCLSLTEAIMPHYPEFPDYTNYFGHYTLLDDIFSDLSIPVSIIASKDDPVVPYHDFLNLKPHRRLKLYLHDYGGHCGFFDVIPFSSWHERKAYQIFEHHIKAL